MTCLIAGEATAQNSNFTKQVFPVQSFLEVATTSDVDGDGDFDVVGATTAYSDSLPDNYMLLTWINDNGILSTIPIKNRFTWYNAGAYSMIAKDMNNDGTNEIILALLDSIKVFSWNSSGFLEVSSFFMSGGAHEVSAGDVDNDGFNDLVVSQWGSPYISVFYGNGSFGFVNIVNYPTHISYKEIKVGKINTDTSESIIFSHRDSISKIVVLKINPNRSISSITTIDSPEPNSVCNFELEDWDNDGSVDLFGIYKINPYSANASNTGRIAMWSGSSSVPDPIWQIHSIPNCTYVSPVVVKFCDGRNDKVIFSDERIISWMPKLSITVNGNLFFVIDSVVCNHSEYGISLADINGDGKIDILLSDLERGLIYLENTSCGILPTSTKKSEELKIYPNPTTGMVQISELPLGSRVTITNALGQTIWFGFGNEIDLSAQSAGLYFLTVSSLEGNKQTTKIIKE